MGQVLHGSATIPLTGRRMQAFAERGAHYPSCNTAIDGFDRGIELNLWFESEDRREVAQWRAVVSLFFICPSHNDTSIRRRR